MALHMLRKPFTVMPLRPVLQPARYVTSAMTTMHATAATDGKTTAPRPGFAVVLEATLPSTCKTMPLPQALQDLWPRRFCTPSAAKKVCRRRLVLVNGTVERGVSMVRAGAQIAVLARVAAGPAAGSGRRGRASEVLTVCYEDEDLAVVSKPAGVAITELRALLVASLQPSTQAEDEPLWRPQHVHRLDKPTSGLLVAAKTGRALRTLSAAFASRSVHKRYRAVVVGRLGESDALGTLATIDLPLSGREARTHWAAIAHWAHPLHGTVTLLDLFPHTGRTHQLRRHLAMLGHPILGDSRYGLRQHTSGHPSVSGPSADAMATCTTATEVPVGDGGKSEGKRDRDVDKGNKVDGGNKVEGALCLAAVEIELAHPRTGEALRVAAPQGAEWVARYDEVPPEGKVLATKEARTAASVRQMNRLRGGGGLPGSEMKAAGRPVSVRSRASRCLFAYCLALMFCLASGAPSGKSGGSGGGGKTGGTFSRTLGHSPKMCVRNHTCDTCAPMPTLPAHALAAAVRDKHLQFWGDSVQAQMECDFRYALNAIAPFTDYHCSLVECGARYPSLNSSVKHVWAGCPHMVTTCSPERHQIHELPEEELLAKARGATHIIFNIGAHYEEFEPTNLLESLRRFHAVFTRSGAKLIVRSQAETHFPTTDGLWMSPPRTDLVTHRPAGEYCVPHPPPIHLHFTEIELRRFARKTGAAYLDVRGPSHDHTTSSFVRAHDT